jgi:ADP-ribose pyrophosphatase
MSQSRGPWTVHSSESKYHDEFVELIVDHVDQPDGQRGEHVVVRMPRGVAVLPIDDEGRVYLVRQFRYALGGESLEVAGGGVEDGEEPLAAARRELREELGLEAGEWIEQGEIRLATEMLQAPVHLYVAKGLRFTEPDRDGTEAMARERLMAKEALKAVLSGEIVQAASCVLILKALCTGAP